MSANLNHPSLHTGKLRASDLRVIEPGAVLTDDQLEQLMRRHPAESGEPIESVEAASPWILRLYFAAIAVGVVGSWFAARGFA